MVTRIQHAFGRATWLVALATIAVPAANAAAQGGGSSETSRLKTAFLADFADLQNKFTALAEAFPADKYAWQPMPGVRTVHQILGLIASENYLSLTTAFGVGFTPHVFVLDETSTVTAQAPAASLEEVRELVREAETVRIVEGGDA